MAAAQVPLTQWNPNKKYSDRERWVCIYPAYINSKKTRQEGRKIAKENAVDTPTYQEIKDVLAVANFPIVIENKLYPREKSKELQHRGRIRVQLKKDDGTPLNPNLPTRESLLVHLGQTIPQLKTRQNKQTEPAQASSSTTAQKKNKKRR